MISICACGPSAGDTAGGTSAAGATSGTTSGTSTPGSSSTASSSDAAESSTTAASVPAPDGCTCRDRSSNEWAGCEELADIECAGEELCPPLALRCPREENPDLYACDRELVYDEEALDCMLAALHDRNPGKLFTSRPGVVCGLEGCGSDAVEIVVLADGNVVTTACGNEPLSPAYSSSSVRMLREPAYFAECLELDGPRDRYACMFEGMPIDGGVCG